MIRSLWLVSASLTAVSIASMSNAQSSTETYSYDALGRLVKVVTSGGQNNLDTQSYCYDDAGNRTEVVANTSNGTTICTGGSPPPSPPPPPPSGNSPPVAVDDSATGACSTNISIQVTNNDSDPDGNVPLSATNVVRTSGQATVNSWSGGSVSISLPAQISLSTFTYTVTDTLGATDTAVLTAAVSACDGGGGGRT